MTTTTRDADVPIRPRAPAAYLRVGVLASGRGTNLQALLDRSCDPNFPARVVAVVSDRPEAAALERGRRAGVPVASFPRRAFRSRTEQEEAIVAFLREQRVELVVLAGYVPILGPTMLNAFPERIINIHPSLLPAFGGTLHAQAEALRYGVKISGCTVHLVTSEVDAGPIILQRAVPVHEDDTEETLAERILAEEHIALPEAVRLIAEGRVVVEGRRVRILPAKEA